MRVNRAWGNTRATLHAARENARKRRTLVLVVLVGHGLFAFRDHEAVVSLPWKLSSRMGPNALRLPTYLSFPLNFFFFLYSSVHTYVCTSFVRSFSTRLEKSRQSRNCRGRSRRTMATLSSIRRIAYLFLLYRPFSTFTITLFFYFSLIRLVSSLKQMY